MYELRSDQRIQTGLNILNFEFKNNLDFLKFIFFVSFFVIRF